MTKVLVTGAKGFIGKNLVSTLELIEDYEVYAFDLDSPEGSLETYTKDCDFVFHLAGINRPQDEREFMEGNFAAASELLALLKAFGNKCPIMLSSSTHAAGDSAYGRSKKAGEDRLFDYAKTTGSQVYVFRFPNVFGKWCRPNYNSAVATFCHNIAHELPIQVTDRTIQLNLVYIDDVVNSLLACLRGEMVIESDGFCRVQPEHQATLGEIVDLLYAFKESRQNYMIPELENASFAKKLYSSYLSYLPEDSFAYPAKMNVDQRGSFTELFKTAAFGQVSVNIAKPGIEKGNHWHHTKNEKFVVVSGKGRIQFRKIGTDEVITYDVSGDKIEIVDIPTGYTHNIINTGEDDLVTVMWANELFDPEHPDTYYLRVNE